MPTDPEVVIEYIAPPEPDPAPEERHLQSMPHSKFLAMVGSAEFVDADCGHRVPGAAVLAHWDAATEKWIGQCAECRGDRSSVWAAEA